MVTKSFQLNQSPLEKRISFMPFTVSFLLIAFGSPYVLNSFKVDPFVFKWVNLTVFLATILSFFFYRKAIGNKNPHNFFQMVYLGMFVKMLILLFAAFLYIYIAGKSVNKPAILAGMAAYLIYSTIEMYLILQLNKKKGNAEERSAS